MSSRDGWRRVKFGDVVRNVSESVTDPVPAGLERAVGLEHLDPGELAITRWASTSDGLTFTRRFRAGQVLYGRRRVYQRKAAVPDFDGVCSGDIYVLEASNEELLPELLPFIVQSEPFHENALRTSAGSLSPRTKWTDLRAYEFDLPPIEEQREIVQLISGIEAVVRAWRRLASQVDQLARGFIEQLATMGGSHHRLGDVCEMQNGRAFPSSEYRSTGIRLLRPGDLGRHGKIAWSDATRCMPVELGEQYEDWLLDEGDVVVNLTAQSLEDGFLGRTCLLRSGDRSLLNQRIGRLSLRPSRDALDAAFLATCLRSRGFQNWCAARSEGSKIRHLYWRHLEDYSIPAIPLEEQRAAIVQLGQVEACVDRVRDQIHQARFLAQHLSRRLLP